MEQINEKLEKILDGQNEMNTILVKQQVLLDEHIRRTNLLEEHFGELETSIVPLKDDLIIRKAMRSKMITLFTILTGLGGLILGILKFLEK